MKIHEYQAKELFRRFGVPAPEGRICTTADEAAAAAAELGGTVVVKAQIHAGGRGKAGGVKVVKSPDEARAAAQGMLGKTLVTHQTGPEGKEVLKVWVERGSTIAKEYYLSLVVDRASAGLAVIASTEGGMDIEAVAAATPERILTTTIDPVAGYQPHIGRTLARRLGLAGDQIGAFAKLLGSLVRLFQGTDASMVEINPLILTGEGALLALDGKVGFDDNALFRHKDLLELRDLTEEDPREIEASTHDLNYIKLDGEVGCMVNGAGLAMATMDVIRHLGGTPANFLDIGGSSSPDKVVHAMSLLVSDSNVRAIFINVFGGITRCDDVARGLVTALERIDTHLPFVVRLTGTNEEEGRRILEGAGIHATSDMTEGARRAIALARGEGAGA